MVLHTEKILLFQVLSIQVFERIIATPYLLERQEKPFFFHV